MFAVGWFMTLFSSLETLPLQTVIVIWDYVLAMQWPGMMRIVLAVLQVRSCTNLVCDVVRY